MLKKLGMRLGFMLIVGFLLLTVACTTKAPIKADVTGQPSEEEISARRKAESEKAAKEAAERAEHDRLSQEDLERQRKAEGALTGSEREEVARVIENETIYFDYNSAELSPDSMQKLKRKAEILKKYPQVTVRIEGNCDERGTNEYNLALGERRAKRAAEYLIRLDISSSRIETISYGEERPIDPGHTEDAWAKNRRAEFIITSR